MPWASLGAAIPGVPLILNPYIPAGAANFYHYIYHNELKNKVAEAYDRGSIMISAAGNSSYRKLGSGLDKGHKQLI